MGRVDGLGFVALGASSGGFGVDSSRVCGRRRDASEHRRSWGAVSVEDRVRRWRTVLACEKVDQETKEACSYCGGAKLVVCPVCNGEGVMGRTILCRYCRGKKELDCPVCAAEDDYAWTFDEEQEGSETGSSEESK